MMSGTVNYISVLFFLRLVTVLFLLQHSQFFVVVDEYVDDYFRRKLIPAGLIDTTREIAMIAKL